MTEKELRKLHRHDLLELLVEQSKETVRLNTVLKETESELAEVTEGNGRLKDKLNEKDELIEKLKARLDEKDADRAEETAQTQEALERLKGKLDEKDALIEKLKGRLDEKDAKLAEEAELIEKLRSRLDSRDEKIEMLEAEKARLQSDRWKELQERGLPPELIAGLKALL